MTNDVVVSPAAKVIRFKAQKPLALEFGAIGEGVSNLMSVTLELFDQFWIGVNIVLGEQCRLSKTSDIWNNDIENNGTLWDKGRKQHVYDARIGRKDKIKESSKGVQER